MLKSTNKVETNRYELTITVDEATFADACAKAYKKVGPKINIPGFRKGKAPRTIIEKYYGGFLRRCPRNPLSQRCPVGS